MDGTLALVDGNGGSASCEPSPSGDVVDLVTNLDDGVADEILVNVLVEASQGGAGCSSPGRSSPKGVEGGSAEGSILASNVGCGNVAECTEVLDASAL